MNPKNLEFISIPPKTPQPPQGLIVMLHGWGANALDLASLTPMLDLPDYYFVFPDAPMPHPQAPDGKMWYDLSSEAYTGLAASREILRQWLLSLENVTGVPLSRTILSGFSQGGAMTLDVGITLPLAGLIALSGYLHSTPLPCQGELPPMLMVHGRYDSVVPLGAAVQARDEFAALGATVQYHELDMAHEIIPQEIDLIRHFILKTLSKVDQIA